MLITLNKEIINTLSETELRIVQFINQNAERLSQLSIMDIAFETYSSPASVSRAIRKCHLSGFNELRYKLTHNSVHNDVLNLGEVINKSLREVQQTIEQIAVAKVLDIIEQIKQAKRIFIFARGLTEEVASEFALKLQLLDFNAVAIRDPNIMKIKSQTMTKQNLLFLFSLNGYTQELIESAQNANYSGATVMSCTCNPDSPLLAYSDHYLLGYKNSNVAIKTYEVASRLPLQIMARIIIDYLVLNGDNK
ncbi:RpiR family transcriptional regulator [Volucribacter psittacicida]|uniref:RpiR family transcriptional regulator n=1 Tax=Volucribacter psittacicida TaxID=203482 RepID=A0A4R1FV18_9PAST|nr:MurR/RpiR family transcriptional regulator [Volucribacter psittacicida]TCJ98777.1 RpiR family transcriptional regulator [Volucribacter psittacicida]